MIKKQDIAKARTPSDLERRYNFGQSFAEVMGLAQDAQKAADVAQKAADEAKEALSDLDQEAIFNLLTNNGTVQGLYRGDDGQIYINASYVKSGILYANLVNAGILKSKDGTTFYLDLDNGVLQMKADSLSIGGETVETIATEKAQSAVDNQTQTDIFRKLTNNGDMQGLYMENGMLYVNASYIKSGEFLADLIKAGVIKSKDGKSVVIDLDNGLVNLIGNITTQKEQSDVGIRFAKVYPGGLHAEGEWGAIIATGDVQPGYIELNGNNSNVILQADLFGDGQAYWSIYSNGKSLGAYVTADRSMITGLTEPIGSTDAVNKDYVDGKTATALYNGYSTSTVTVSGWNTYHTFVVICTPTDDGGKHTYSKCTMTIPKAAITTTKTWFQAADESIYTKWYVYHSGDTVYFEDSNGDGGIYYVYGIK